MGFNAGDFALVSQSLFDETVRDLVGFSEFGYLEYWKGRGVTKGHW